jgi:hypothetical protein
MNRLFRCGFATLLCTLMGTALAYAQATRTWVSGVGDDANPCSRTAPCKTFAGAISKTAAGGEISALDPGGFGAVTITKSITINGDGTLAGILAAGTNGIIVNAGSGVVTLRNLSINGGGTGLNGIRYLGGAALIVERSTLSGFKQRNIDVSLSGAGALVLMDVSMSGGTAGVRVNSTGGRVEVSLSSVSIKGATTGIDALVGLTTVTDSVITHNSGHGVLAGGGTVTVENSMLTSNNVAVEAQPGATIRLSNNGVYDNLTGFACGGGTLASAGNNRKGGNVGGSVPVCAPNAVIAIQ